MFDGFFGAGLTPIIIHLPYSSASKSVPVCHTQNPMGGGRVGNVILSLMFAPMPRSFFALSFPFNLVPPPNGGESRSDSPKLRYRRLARGHPCLFLCFCISFAPFYAAVHEMKTDFLHSKKFSSVAAAAASAPE